MDIEKQSQLIAKGCEYLDEKNYEKARYYFSKTLQKTGKFNAECKYYLGIVSFEEKDYYTAFQYFQEAAEENSNEKIKVMLQPKIYVKMAHTAYLLGFVRHATLYFAKLCNMLDSFKESANMYGSYLLSLSCLNADSTKIKEEAQKFNRLADIYIKDRKTIKENDIYIYTNNVKKKIHIAYMSPDYRNHVMFCFYYALLKYYDTDKFYVSCIALNEEDDKYTELVKKSVDNYVNFSGFSFEKLAEKSKEMNIDILVDLAGYSADSGLPVFGYRIAPVQISGLGWMETTGYDAVDYLITDKYLDPEGSDYITEKPLYLTSQFCYMRNSLTPETQGAPCKQNGYITFGIFNRVSKFTDEILELWRQIMDAVPDSKMIMKCKVLESKSAQNLIRKRLADAGLDDARIIMEGATADYMTRYLDVDIALDTYPYTGGGTTFDALYMGVPVVSLYGERRSSRFGLSILSNAGVGELAVPTPEEYVERAVALANDWELLDVLHKNLRTMLKKSSAMDAEGYVREMEMQYEKLLQNALEGK